MAKKTKIVRDVSEIALELLNIRREKNALIATDKTLTAELKRRIKDGEQQDMFVIEKYPTLQIADHDKAVAWTQHEFPHLITVDMPSIRKVLKQQFTLPDGFMLEDTERLVETEANDTEE